MSSWLPRVTIGLPVYNGGLLLRDALESLLRQTARDFELLISDNASVDDTEQICREIGARDQRVRYHRNQRNLGSSANFERVVEMARGEFFAWAGHDDLWAELFLSECLKPFEEDARVVLAFPQTEVVYPSGKRSILADAMDTRGVSRPYLRVRQVHRGAVYRTAIFGLMRTAAVRAALPFGKVLGPDHAFLALLALAGEFAHVSKPLFVYRMGPHYRLRWRSRELYEHYQRSIEPDAVWKRKYHSFWPTAGFLCRRTLGTRLAAWEKIRVILETLRWCVREELVERGKESWWRRRRAVAHPTSD